MVTKRVYNVIYKLETLIFMQAQYVVTYTALYRGVIVIRILWHLKAIMWEVLPVYKQLNYFH